jgi:hypothetical protein
MNPPSMESIFLILSGVVLAAGVLYWFWSHIQLTQKKVQLLENAVFELRGMLTQGPAPAQEQSQQVKEQVEAPVYNDLADDEEEDWVPSTQTGSTSLEELASDDQASDALAPGGAASKGVAPESPADIQTAEKFRELFIQHEQLPSSPRAADAPVGNASLDSMPVKELRRLAEQRGITGVSDLKKKELLSALRQQVTAPPTSVTANKEVVVERTLDLTEVEELGAEVEVEAPALE